MLQIIYTLIIYPLIHTSFWILSFFIPKIKSGFEMRRGKSWIKTDNKSSESSSPIFWFHVASGEFEYAKPVIQELKNSINCKILVTYFSPSVKKSVESNKLVDWAVPSPWDTPWHWHEFIKHYKPSVLAIARTDLWPNMIWVTKRKKIPSILFSATLTPQSARVASFFGRLFYSFVTEDLSEISVVTEEDKDNFMRISHDSKVTVDGDTRFDQVFNRLETSNDQAREQIKKLFNENSDFLIAGSTWPEDEKVLIPAIAEFSKSKNLNFIIAPHEVDETHLMQLQRLCAHYKLSTEYFSKTLPPYVTGNKILIVDQVGILASLYPLGSLAFVGGSFRKSVHSVMEPAAAGCLTFVGPFHHGNREALLLKQNNFVKEISSTQDFIQEFEKAEVRSPLEKEKLKLDIQNFVRSQTGASKVIANRILALVKSVSEIH